MTPAEAVNVLWRRHERGVEMNQDGEWHCCGCGDPLPCQEAVALATLEKLFTTLTPELLAALEAHVRASAVYRMVKEQRYATLEERVTALEAARRIADADGNRYANAMGDAMNAEQARLAGATSGERE